MSMNQALKAASMLIALMVSTSVAFADNEVEGPVEATDPEARAFIVQGIHIFTDEGTDFGGGLERFDDIQVGQTVEVDFVYRDGRHLANEVDRED